MESKLLFHLVMAEFLLACTTLCLFSYGYTSTTRTYLWEDGGAQHFNSDPRPRIYFYANHLEPPPIPYLWSQAFTDFNLGVAIIAFWVGVTKMLLLILKVRVWRTEVFLQCCVLLAWILCFVNQLSGDMSDEEYKSARPWYLTHSCATASPEEFKYACQVAQAVFVFTCLSTLLAFVVLALNVIEFNGQVTIFRVQRLNCQRKHHGKEDYDLVESTEDESLEM